MKSKRKILPGIMKNIPRTFMNLHFRYGLAVGAMLASLMTLLLQAEAQQSASQQPAQASSAPKSIALQVVTVGQQIPPKYKVEAAKNLTLPTAGDGGNDKNSTGRPKAASADVAVQIPFEADELPPGPLYVKNGKEWVGIQNVENSASGKIMLQPTSSVTLAVGVSKPDSQGGVNMHYDTLGEFPVEPNQDAMLILLIKDPSKPLKWKLAKTVAVNTSWAQMPAGSISIYNASGLTLRSQIAQDVINSLPAFQTRCVKPAANSDGIIPYLIDIQPPGGNWQRVVNTAVSPMAGTRLILVPYGLVEPKTGRVADVIMIRDSQVRPEGAQQASNTETTASGS